VLVEDVLEDDGDGHPGGDIGEEIYRAKRALGAQLGVHQHGHEERHGHREGYAVHHVINGVVEDDHEVVVLHSPDIIFCANPVDGAEGVAQLAPIGEGDDDRKNDGDEPEDSEQHGRGGQVKISLGDFLQPFVFNKARRPKGNAPED
jgi:hypothetical protein